MFRTTSLIGRCSVLFLGAICTLGCGEEAGPSDPRPRPARGDRSNNSSSASPSTSPTTPGGVETPGTFLPTPTETPPREAPIWSQAPTEPAMFPLSVGTLALTTDGKTAVASDADRGAIFIVDLAALSARRVSVSRDAQLGQIIVDNQGSAYVLGRGTDEVLRIDLARAEITARYPVCASPQGIAVSADAAVLHVACRMGELVTLEAATGAKQRTLTLDDDLRDVVVHGAGLVVSRFRSAQLIVLDAAGKQLRRIQPGEGAHVAWRTLGRADGRIVVAHQMNTVGTLPAAFQEYYGSGCSGSISQPTVSLFDVDAETPSVGSELPNPTVPVIPHLRMRHPLSRAAGVTDIAISATSSRVAAIVPGNALALELMDAVIELPSVDASPVFGGCKEATVQAAHPEVPVAVAFDPEGRTVLQTKSPALLKIIGRGEVSLSAETLMNTGFRMFHMNTSRNTACAACHPEGRDDGYTWKFPDFGYRRTQNLEGNAIALAPYHWDGLLSTFDNFVDEVLVTRMGLSRKPSAEETQALSNWLATVPAPKARITDVEAVARGAALFNDKSVGCAECHSGAQYTDNKLYDVGTGGEFVTPPLVGVAMRAPYFHDGCAATLHDRFGACGGGDKHGKTSQLSSAQITDLLAFLSSLDGRTQN